MVYGVTGRSREADIVIWDADNYPSLPLTDNSFYFAESVRVVLESKSGWSNEQFEDVRDKCRSISNIVPVRSITLDDQMAVIRQELSAIKSGRETAGILIARPLIGTAAIFMSRGQTAMDDLNSLPGEIFNDADISWPDVILWLDPGRIALKQYPEGEGSGRVEVYDYGDDSLFVFTNHLLQLLAHRTVILEDHFYMDSYMTLAEGQMISSRSFPLVRARPEYRPLWRD